MRMRLLQYDATIVYKPRKQLYLADALSRVCINDREKLKMHVAMVTESLNITEKQIERFQNETIKDHALQDVIKLVRTGWPEHRNAVPDSAKPYFTVKENLYKANGLLFKKESLVVPMSLRAEMLKRINFNHMGIEKCKLRARKSLYWPGMSNGIENLLSNCEACAKFHRLNRKDPMILREVPEAPWQVVGSDLFYLDRKDYMSK